MPEPPSPAGLYVPATRSGNLVFTAGQLAFENGSLLSSGIVGESVSPDIARECAKRCALNALSAARTVCDLDDVTGVVKVVCYVASSPSFNAQPKVADGASEVMARAFGESGVHAREAVGVVSLPLGSPVEVSIILQLA